MKKFYGVLFAIFFATTPAAIIAQTNQALTFAQSGDMDQIQVPPSLLTNFSGDFTINLRVSLDMLNHWHMLVTNNTFGPGIELSFTSNFLTFTTTGSSANIAIQHGWFPVANTWYMVTLVRNGNVYKEFIDGVLLGQAVSNAPYPNYDLQGLRIGNYYAAQSSFNFRGKMDDVSFWNTAVSDSFVLDSLLNNSFSMNAAGLVLYYDMDTTGAGAGIQVSNRGGQGGAALHGVTVGSFTTPYFTPNLVLPLTLTDFAVQACGSDACLTWKTQAEIQLSHFEVERSADALHFETVARIESAGHFTGEKKYAIRDSKVSGHTIFYRLKCVDLDGGFVYSTIVPCHLDETQGVQVLSHGHGRFILNTDVLVSDLRVFNLFGQEVPLPNTTSIDLSGQPAGLYLIRFRAGNQPMTRTVSNH